MEVIKDDARNLELGTKAMEYGLQILADFLHAEVAHSFEMGGRYRVPSACTGRTG